MWSFVHSRLKTNLGTEQNRRDKTPFITDYYVLLKQQSGPFVNDHKGLNVIQRRLKKFILFHKIKNQRTGRDPVTIAEVYFASQNPENQTLLVNQCRMEKIIS